MADLSANFHALAIGVGHYISRGFNALPATVNDAKLLRDTLLDPKRCGYRPENVRVLTDIEATVPHMRQELARLTEVSGPGSTVMVFFSGHGWRPAGDDAAPGYLCLHEADLLDMDDSALAAAVFTDAISALRAERVVVILDCCHANSTAQIKSPGGTQWKSGLPDSYYQALSESGGGRVVIASCRDDEQSYVRPRGDYSYFTYSFVDSLRSRADDSGLIRIVDVFHSAAQVVSGAVRSVSLALGEDFTQTPIFKGQFESNFPIAYDQRSDQPGENAAVAQPATQSPAPQSVGFLNIAPNDGMQVHVGKHEGPSYTATTMNFGLRGPKSDGGQ